MKKWFLLIILTALLTTGCQHNKLIKRGDAHFEQGNYSAALQSYRAAQQRKPNSKKIRQRIEAAEERLLDSILVGTREALAAGDYVAAIEYASFGLSEFPRERPIHDNVETVVERVSRAADEDLEQGYFASALFLYQSLDHNFVSHERRLAPRIALIRERWSAVLIAGAEESIAAGLEGRAFVLLSKAHELVPATNQRARAQSLRQSVVARHRYHVSVPVPMRPTSAVRAIAGRLFETPYPVGLIVASTGPEGDEDTAGAAVHLQTQNPRFERTRHTRSESVEYQSGVRQVRNPDHGAKLVEVDEKKKEVALAQVELTRHEADLRRLQLIVAREGAPQDRETEAQRNLASAQKVRDQARADLDARDQELAALEEELRALPRFVEEPVFGTHNFPVTTHRVTARLPLSGRVEGQNTQDTLSLDTTIELAFEDDAYPAQPIIDLPGKDPALPSQDELTRQLHEEAANHVLSKIDESFHLYRGRFVEEAHRTHDGARRVDLMVTYLLLDPEGSDEDLFYAVAELEDIPNAVDFFF